MVLDYHLQARATMKALCYYSHRFGNDPANLARARQRFAELKALWAAGLPDVVLWAPWLDMAEAAVDEEKAWHVIDAAIKASSTIAFDLDGEQLSAGMRTEKATARRYGLEIITISFVASPVGERET